LAPSKVASIAALACAIASPPAARNGFRGRAPAAREIAIMAGNEGRGGGGGDDGEGGGDGGRNGGGSGGRRGGGDIGESPSRASMEDLPKIG